MRAYSVLWYVHDLFLGERYAVGAFVLGDGETVLVRAPRTPPVDAIHLHTIYSCFKIIQRHLNEGVLTVLPSSHLRMGTLQFLGTICDAEWVRTKVLPQ